VKAGFVAILGRPNVGKSTLLNALVGQKISIVSSKPQTTRDAIRGIYSAEEGQIVFVDSPGIHEPKLELGRRMDREVGRASEGCHAALVVADASAEKIGKGDRAAIERAAAIGVPLILVLNKIDRLADKRELLPRIAAWAEAHPFEEIVPVSALKRDGMKLLTKLIFERLPEAPAFYPEDEITDQPARFLAAELIRERILRDTEQEVPHHTTVLIEKWEETPTVLRLSALVYVERDTQKAILLGSQGKRMKAIASEARRSLERAFDRRVFLEVFVKVKPKWRDQSRFLSELEREQMSPGADSG